MALQYNESYHCRCSLILDGGVEVTLKSLSQHMTYRGMLEGVPTADTNDQLLEAAVSEAAKAHRQLSVRPFLIPPKRRDYHRAAGDMESIRQEWWIPEWLPMITCIGAFESSFPAGNQAMHGSIMVVVWFQDEFALPIPEPILKAIQACGWKANAVDFEY